jgi:hypothetical protein
MFETVRLQLCSINFIMKQLYFRVLEFFYVFDIQPQLQL